MATQLRDLDGTFSAETVERFMAESLEALGGARLKNYAEGRVRALLAEVMAPV